VQDVSLLYSLSVAAEQVEAERGDDRLGRECEGRRKGKGSKRSQTTTRYFRILVGRTQTRQTMEKKRGERIATMKSRDDAEVLRE